MSATTNTTTPAATAPKQDGTQGEKAAEEVKGGIKGFNNWAEGIRKNINAFADDLMNKKAKKQPTSPEAKAAGAEVEKKVSGTTTSTTTTPATATTEAPAPAPANDATATPQSHATGQPVVSK